MGVKEESLGESGSSGWGNQCLPAAAVQHWDLNMDQMFQWLLL